MPDGHLGFSDPSGRISGAGLVPTFVPHLCFFENSPIQKNNPHTLLFCKFNLKSIFKVFSHTS